jgi:hypothetical protein
MAESVASSAPGEFVRPAGTVFEWAQGLAG